MPLKEYVCRDCGHIQEEFFRQSEEIPRKINCNHCETHTSELLPSAIGGYSIHGNNTASVRPKRAGSFKKG